MPASEPSRSRVQRRVRSPRAAARGLWALSLFALVVVLAVRPAGGAPMPTDRPIASLQTR